MELPDDERAACGTNLCVSAPGDGFWFSASRPSAAAGPATETATHELSLFGYVLARLETFASYGQPAAKERPAAGS